MDIDLRQPFIKANLLNVDEAWDIIGKNKDTTDLSRYYREVSYLFRGVDILSNAVSRMPFTIYQGDNAIDDSQDYQNKLGFLPNPGYMFGIIEAALQIWGISYLFRMGNAMALKKLRYLVPTSIKYEINEYTGMITFTRNVNGTDVKFTEDDIIYFWQSDPYVELGAPTTSPAQAAAQAAAVLFNVDEFATAFFLRGAIKAQLFSVGGNVVETERNKFKTFLGKLFKGSGNSWAYDIVNADKVTVTEIGEGLDSLDNKVLTEEQREAIATALGIPHSILFSNAANFAVSDKDDFHFYDKKIVPDCVFIQSVMNEQLLVPMGYRLKFEWETLDIFQEDEKERAASLQFLTQTLEKGPIAGIGMDILGYEVPEETMLKLEQIWADQEAQKEQQRQDFMARMNQAQGQPQDDDKPRIPKEGDIKSDADVDLEKWKRYAQKRVKAGKVPDREFESDNIEGAVKGAIYEALKFCETVEEVDAVFGDVWKGYP